MLSFLYLICVTEILFKMSKTIGLMKYKVILILMHF